MHLIFNYHRKNYYIHVMLNLAIYRPSACCNQPLVIHSDLKKHNILCKKSKCSVNMNNIASAQNDYMSMFTN